MSKKFGERLGWAKWFTQKSLEYGSALLGYVFPLLANKFPDTKVVSQFFGIPTTSNDAVSTERIVQTVTTRTFDSDLIGMIDLNFD